MRKIPARMTVHTCTNFKPKFCVSFRQSGAVGSWVCSNLIGLGNNPCSCNRTVTYPLMSEFMDNCNVWIIDISAINQHLLIMFSWLNICTVHENTSIRWSLRVYILIIVAAFYKTKIFIFDCQFSVVLPKWLWPLCYSTCLQLLYVTPVVTMYVSWSE